MPRTRLYRDGVLEAEGFPIADVSDHLADESATIWFDLCKPTAEELASVSEELGLHPLAVEDAVQEHQRPKLDRYQSHLFVTAYSVALDTVTGELTTCEVDAFITRHALVTVRKDDRFDVDQVVARWDQSPDLAKYGVAFLLHGLLDYVVDTHFDAVQSLDTEIESLEDQLFDDKPKDREMQRRTFQLRKSLVTVRGNRLNVIMKQVTSWAAIIAVPTAVTGFYGQNVPYPGFGQPAGFWTSTVITIGLSALLYIVFRRKDWL